MKRLRSFLLKENSFLTVFSATLVSSAFFLYVYSRGTWGPEESVQYFPKILIETLGKNTFLLDGQPIAGQIYSAFPIGFLLMPLSMIFPSSAMPKVVAFILQLLLSFSVSLLFHKLLRNSFLALLGTIIVISSVSFYSTISYLSKTSSIVFFCLSILILGFNSLTWKTSLTFLILGICCLGKFGNLATAVSSWIALLVIIPILRKSQYKRFSLVILPTLIIEITFFYFVYLRNPILMEYASISQNQVFTIENPLHFIVGDGYWLVFGGWGESRYLPSFPDSNSPYYSIKIFIAVLTLGFGLVHFGRLITAKLEANRRISFMNRYSSKTIQNIEVSQTQYRNFIEKSRIDFTLGVLSIFLGLIIGLPKSVNPISFLAEPFPPILAFRETYTKFSLIFLICFYLFIFRGLRYFSRSTKVYFLENKIISKFKVLLLLTCCLFTPTFIVSSNIGQEYTHLPVQYRWTEAQNILNEVASTSKTIRYLLDRGIEASICVKGRDKLYELWATNIFQISLGSNDSLSGESRNRSSHEIYILRCRSMSKVQKIDGDSASSYSLKPSCLKMFTQSEYYFAVPNSCVINRPNIPKRNSN